MWCKIRGQITLFHQLFKRDLITQNIKCTTFVLTSIKGSIMLTIKEEDKLEDIEEDGTNNLDFEEEKGAE
jgi:hypothetical protein